MYKDFLPSPLDIGDVRGFLPGSETEEETEVRKPDEKEPFSALAFKIAAHPFYGKLTFIRVYSGKVESGAQVLNSTKGKKERISETTFGKKAKGIKLPDIKATREVLSRLDPQRFLNTKAENPKQILKKKLIR